MALPGSSRLRSIRQKVASRPWKPLWLALICAGASAANLAVIPLSFGIQFLPGSILAVLAVLLFGRWGVAIGSIASLITIQLWGHPWAVIIFSAEVTWLYGYLLISEGRFNRRKLGTSIQAAPIRRRDDGGVILADIVFWLLVGMPMVLFFYGVVLGLDNASVTVVALKQSVNGIINAALGFVLYLLIRSRIPPPGQEAGLSILGVSFSAILMAITLPSLGLTKVVSQQLELSAEQGQAIKLRLVGDSALALPPANLQAMARSLASNSSRIAIARWDQGRLVYNSDPPLFQRLRRDYLTGEQNEIQHKHLRILINRHENKLLKTWLTGFWIHDQSSFRHGVPQRVIVVEAAHDLVIELQRQSARLIAMLASVVLIGALISELLGRLIAAQFMRVLNPGRHRSNGNPGTLARAADSSGPIPLLSETWISELNAMVRLINNRIANNNRLTQALRRSNQQLSASKQELEKLSVIDPLTGCFNRRELHRRLDDEIRRCGRSGTALSCLCIDLDHFKRINDTYGHPIGDEVLQRVAGEIAARIRSTDCLCRSGGEEFTLLLSFCDREAACELAEHLRHSIAQLSIGSSEQAIRVTISIGVTAYLPDRDSAASLLSRADRALYRAKGLGRNRVHSE